MKIDIDEKYDCVLDDYVNKLSDVIRRYKKGEIGSTRYLVSVYMAHNVARVACNNFFEFRVVSSFRDVDEYNECTSSKLSDVDFYILKLGFELFHE